MKYFDRIDRRLKGKMSDAEAKVFDKELLENEELATAFEIQQLEENMLDFAVEEDILARVRKIGKEEAFHFQEEKEPKVVKMVNWRKSLSLAAGMALLVTASYFIFQGINSEDSSRILAQEYYAEYPPNLSGNKAIGDKQNALEANKLLLLSVNEEDIKTAISFFESQKSTSSIAAFYLGHGYWVTKDYKKSLLNFEYFSENSSQNPRFVPQAEFYKSLALLAMNNVDEAKQFINEKKVDHPFQKQWEELLEQL